MFEAGAQIENELPARAGHIPEFEPVAFTNTVPIILTPLVNDAGKPLTDTMIGSVAPPLLKDMYELALSGPTFCATPATLIVVE